MREVFIDAGYLVALELRRDQNHESALAHWREHMGSKRIEKTSQTLLVTTTYVLDEVLTFLNARGHHTRAVEIGERLLRSPAVELIHVGEPLFHKAFDYFKAHHDKRYSLTDAVSFVVMSERGLTTAFAFDRHFTQAGFTKEP
jgi:uncharacterized protein